MNEKFDKLIKLLDLKDIRLLDSHESLLELPKRDEKTEVSIKAEQMYPNEDPGIDSDVVFFRPKYIFSFSINEKDFFRCEYIMLISFTCSNISEFQELLKDDEVKRILYEKQLGRTLWSVLRGIVMEAFNRHSIEPVILPWVR